jgi:hypothetical protein
MKMQDLLKQRQTQIAAKWLQSVFETYPPETSQFLKREKDRFANPVGQTISRGLEAIYDHLLRETDIQEALQPLDSVVRIKAVQDFSPGEAVDFLFRLKAIVRDEAEALIRENRMPVRELLEFESKIDRLALQAFNVFVKCREKIYDIKVSELQNRTYRLLKRANLVVEFPDDEFDGGEVENTK